MRVQNLNWREADEMIQKASIDRARKAAHVVAEEARRRCPVGTVSRPIATKGAYAGQPWTARDGGTLKKSIRVVQRREDKYGAAFRSFGITHGMVRVYAGHYMAWYARIVEYFKPFMRPAVEASRGKVKDILENG